MQRLIALGYLLLVSMLSWAEPSRVISTDARVTEMLLALGAKQQLVAVDVTSAVPNLPSIGYHRQLPAEGLLSLQPDLIIGSEHMGPESTLETLKRAKVDVLKLPTAAHAADLSKQLVILGQRLGRQAQAQHLTNQLAMELDQLRAHDLQGRKVAFLLMLDSTKLRVAGQNTAGHAFIEMLGGQNAVDFANYRTLSAESLIALQPEVLLVASNSKGFSMAKLLSDLPVLNATAAAKNDHIYQVDGSTLVAGLSMGAVQQALDIHRQFAKPL